MAALTFCVCSALEQLCEFANAFVRFGLSAQRSFQYLRAKRKQIEFRRNCRAVWLQELSNKHALSVLIVCEILRRTRVPLTSANYIDTTFVLVKEEMQRRGIDFAAIEASAEAYEVIDTFAVQRRSNAGSDGVDGGHRDYEMVDNFDDIEVLSGDEIDVGTLQSVVSYAYRTQRERRNFIIPRCSCIHTYI